MDSTSNTNFFKKDNYLFGIAIGLVTLVVLYLVTLMLLSRGGLVDGLIYTPRPRLPALIGLAANILLFRYYMVGIKLEKTGKGLLIITFVSFLLVFLFL